ncbi:unnamed protein product, partial [Meganyctiphanes norvegica]
MTSRHACARLVKTITGRMDILLPVFQLIYFVAHFLVSLILSFFFTLLELRHYLILCYQWALQPTATRSSTIQVDAAQLKKIPQHLGVICSTACDTQRSLTTLTKIISWATAYGVHQVSLYDINGVFKQKSNVFRRNLRKLDPNTQYHVVEGFEEQAASKEMYTPYCLNEMTNNSVKVTVNLLSVEDSKSGVVNIAQDLIRSGEKINLECVSSRMTSKWGQDPDLVITVGEALTVLGYLPWQIRLTEFIQTHSLSRFEYADFRQILRIYAKCDQRFGK